MQAFQVGDKVRVKQSLCRSYYVPYRTGAIVGLELQSGLASENQHVTVCIPGAEGFDDILVCLVSDDLEMVPEKQETVIPCRAFGLGTMIDAQLVYHHRTGNVTLEADCMIRYVELWSVYTTKGGNRVAILRTENNVGWHIPAEAWEAIQKERE